MSIDLQIRAQLEGMLRRRRRVELWRNLGLCWTVAALSGAGILLLEKQSGWASSLILPLLALLGFGAAAVVWIRQRRKDAAWSEMARLVETRHPDLDGRLVTALQQQPEPNGQLNYLQQRLVTETVEHGRRNNWAEVIPRSRLLLAQAGHWIALAVFLLTLVGLRSTGGHQLLSRNISEGLQVTPGDVSLERGSSLVVLARFSGTLPAKVELAFGQPDALQRQPLVKSLGDPMFGGSVPEVVSNFVYHVEYGARRSRDFTVNVYEHPRLERADADISFPAYTALPHKRIENTHRLSAVEGSQVDLAFKFNKALASARLVARDKEHTTVPLALDAQQPTATLTNFTLESSKTYDLQLVDPDGRTNKIMAEFVFEALKNRPPELRLTSPRGDLRPSALEEISFEGTVWDDFGVQAFGLGYAVNGQSPKLIDLGEKIPGNEKKPFKHRLRLEDLGVRPDELVSWFVWADDLGPDGLPRRTMGDLYFGEVRPFEEVFREGPGMEGQPGMESGGEDQTGKLADLQKQIVNATWKLEREHNNARERRKTPESKNAPKESPERPGDQSLNSAPPDYQSAAIARLYFHFPKVLGQMAQVDSRESSDRPDALSSKSKSATATRTTGTGQAPKYEEDAIVVLDSQNLALEQAKESLQRQRDPQSATLWQKAVTEMEQALKRLQSATNSPAALKEALTAEQAAYQALIRLQAHEYQVSRSRNRNQSGSSRNQQMQRQLEEMDLTDTENRYENQREAQRTQNPEKREQLQVMSRLQELARRQQDLNQRLKELQTALQEARTDKERAEIQRQLKRLQEEEQQMLADVDELRQRMDRPESQSRMADERRQLDQTRQEIQRASEAASQGAASQALAAGTRAQNQLQQLRDEIRKKNSSQFAEDLRQMRSEARSLARQQDDILKKIKEGNSNDRKSLSDSGDQDQTRAQLARQKEALTNLVERATQVSQQAEEAEPLLSRQLYDTVRKFTQDTAKDLKEAESELLNRGPMTRSLFDLLRDNSEQGAAKLEQITSEMLRLGYLPQAARVGERARTGIENLKKGVERAAESVLGDDAEDLRLAQRQLDELSNQLQNEISEGRGGDSQTNRSRSGTQANSQGDPAGNQQAGTNRTAQASGSPQNGDQPAQAQGQNQQAGQESDSKTGAPSQQAQGQGSPSQQGQGQGRGTPSEQAQGQGASSQQAQAQGQGSPSQQGQGQGAGDQPGDGNAEPSSDPGQPATAPGSLANQRSGSQRQGGNRAGQPGAANGGPGGGDPLDGAAGGGARNFNWDQLRTESARRQSAPLTGEDFATWSDRLREVEELIDEPDLRDDVAKARERARLIRQDFKRDRKKPDWAVVQLQVMKPLTEVRDRIAEELARRESREALVPLDRDPVPNRYSDLVRRYYEELGKEK